MQPKTQAEISLLVASSNQSCLKFLKNSVKPWDFQRTTENIASPLGDIFVLLVAFVHEPVLL